MSHIPRIWSLILLFVWFEALEASNLTFSTFAYPNSTSTTLAGINNGGEIIGSFDTASSYGQGFIRNADGSLVPIVLPYRSIDSPASGINSSGAIVGAFFDLSAARGYLRSPLGMYSIVVDPINPNNSGAQGINDSSQMVGTYVDLSNPTFAHGFFRDMNGNFTTIDDPNMATNSSGNRYTQPNGINDLGLIVGTYTDAAGTHGFLRSSAGLFTTIDEPDANPGTTTVTAINNLGMMIGTFQDASGYHSFIRSADGSTYITLDVPSGFNTTARGINDNGDIVGSYLTSLTQGSQMGFIAVPEASEIPEPATLTLLLAGFAVITNARHRRK